MFTKTIRPLLLILAGFATSWALAGAEAGGRLYAIGGAANNGLLNTVEEFNPVANTWATKAPMPTARNYLAVALSGGKLYAIGGSGNSGLLNTVEEYTPGPTGYILFKN
jgi:Kelch motif